VSGGGTETKINATYYELTYGLEKDFTFYFFYYRYQFLPSKPLVVVMMMMMMVVVVVVVVCLKQRMALHCRPVIANEAFSGSKIKSLRRRCGE